MNKRNQKRQLKESFFNPIMQILPLFVFLIIDHLWVKDHALIFAREYAWYGAIIAGIILTIYVFIAYRRLFQWYLFFLISFFVLILFVSIANMFYSIGRFAPLLDEAIFLLAMLLMYPFQKQVIKLTNKLVSPLVPMTNNIVEIYRYVAILSIILASYIVFFIIFSYLDHYYIYWQVLDSVFIFSLIVLIVYSHLRTRFVHYHLAGDRWLPIVTQQGEMIETIQRMSSLSDHRLYMHPVVRGILIKEGKILVKKSAEKDLFYDKPLWDNVIDAHIGIGEKDLNCLKKSALKSFGIEINKSFCLTEYIHTTPYEKQYALVFLILDYSCELIPNPKKIAQMRWMSVEEIEKELDTGVFDERFVKEFELLKRAGLIGIEEEEMKNVE